MHRLALLTISAALGIVVFVSSCSSDHTPVANSDITEFVGTQPNDMNWVPIPDGDGILMATLVGNPDEHGPLVARYDIPPNLEVMPHTHREVRSYTVLSGVWRLGFGETFDAEKLQSFPQESYYRLPAGVPHFQKAGPEGAVIQIESIGPSSFDPLESPK